MSITTRIPPTSNFIPISIRFKATYNAVTPWRYDFTREITGGVLDNIDVPIIPINKNPVYLLERINFSFTVPRIEYTAAIAANPVPLFYLQLQAQQKELIYQKPWPINDFIQNSESVIYFESNQKDVLIASFRGQISQTPNMIIYPVVYGIFTANLYEINNQKWIEEFGKGITKTTGQSLNT